MAAATQCKYITSINRNGKYRGTWCWVEMRSFCLRLYFVELKLMQNEREREEYNVHCDLLVMYCSYTLCFVSFKQRSKEDIFYIYSANMFSSQ